MRCCRYGAPATAALRPRGAGEGELAALNERWNERRRKLGEVGGRQAEGPKALNAALALVLASMRASFTSDWA